MGDSIDQLFMFTRSPGPRSWIEGGEGNRIATTVFVPKSKKATAVSGGIMLIR